MRNTYFTILLLVTTVLGAKDVYLTPFAPLSPEILAQGGAFTASARGYNALWTNPAGLARESKKKVTVLDIQGDLFMPPTKINEFINLISSNALGNIGSPGPEAMAPINFIQNLLQTNGFGVRLNFTPFGMVMNGIGLGISSTLDVYARGRTLPGAQATMDMAMGGVLGYGIPVVVGPFNMYFGVDVRPILRGYGNSSTMDLLSALSTGSWDPFIAATKVGIAPSFAIDVGMIAELGEWSFGASLRDSAAPVYFKNYNLDYVIKNVLSLGTGENAVDTYLTPLTISTGVAWEPNLGPFGQMVVPKLALDLAIPYRGNQTQSWGTWIHLGGELKILDYLSLRAGLNQGYFTGGVGLHLFFVEANLAIYSQEMGIYAGERRRTSIALDTSFRF